MYALLLILTPTKKLNSYFLSYFCNKSKNAIKIPEFKAILQDLSN